MNNAIERRPTRRPRVSLPPGSRYRASCRRVRKKYRVAGRRNRKVMRQRSGRGQYAIR